MELLPTSNPADVRRVTRAAQVTAVLVLAGAGVFAATALPARSGVPEPEAPEVGASTPGADARPREPLGSRVDATGLAARLEMLGNSPSRVKPPAAAAMPGETGATTTPPPQPEGVRYLGGIFEPGRRFAVLVVGGRQRVIGEGERVPGVPEQGATLAEVTPERVVIRHNAGTLEVAKAVRSGGAVSTLGTAPGAAARGGAAPESGMNPAVATALGMARGSLVGQYSPTGVASMPGASGPAGTFNRADYEGYTLEQLQKMQARVANDPDSSDEVRAGLQQMIEERTAEGGGGDAAGAAGEKP